VVKNQFGRGQQGAGFVSMFLGGQVGHGEFSSKKGAEKRRHNSMSLAVPGNQKRVEKKHRSARDGLRCFTFLPALFGRRLSGGGQAEVKLDAGLVQKLVGLHLELAWPWPADKCLLQCAAQRGKNRMDDGAGGRHAHDVFEVLVHESSLARVAIWAC
jgi:hypothetical protein